MISTYLFQKLRIYQVYHSKQPLTFDHNPFVRCLTSFFFSEGCQKNNKIVQHTQPSSWKRKRSSQDFPIPKRTFTKKKKTAPAPGDRDPRKPRRPIGSGLGHMKRSEGCNFVISQYLQGFIHPNGAWGMGFLKPSTVGDGNQLIWATKTKNGPYFPLNPGFLMTGFL